MKRSRGLVLMKALPPTKGHRRLIEFAKSFCIEGVVLMDTAPDEPFIDERAMWLMKTAYTSNGWMGDVMTLDDQDPNSDGFWKRWEKRLRAYGDFDFVIGSEGYCARVAEILDAQYIPYDPHRQLDDTHATDVRNAAYNHFDKIDIDFQPYLRTTVTIFGAESTGKTTLSRHLADVLTGEWVFEWARPYLEVDGPEADLRRMHNIWHGQWAVEENAIKVPDKPFIFRDTDLYSTIGYWEQPHWQKELGDVPIGLLANAETHKAELYIITGSNIPFEKDPLRYGGDHRESPDSYWLNIADKYELPYVYLTEQSRNDRLHTARASALNKFFSKTEGLHYQRKLVDA